MTMMKQTTQGKATMQAKPAMVQPPQHQHTTNITISGVGESEDAEFREPTPSQASSASPKSTDTRPVASRPVSTNRGAKKTPPFTDGIEFLVVGLSEKRGKFLLVGKDDKHVVLSVRNLARDPNTELERLEALDVHLLVPHARQAFLRRAQEAAKMEPTFKVATQIGWFDDVFVLPDRVYPPQPPIQGMPPGWSRILVHLDAKDEDIHSRFHCHGSPQKSQEIFRLCRGNSRLMFAAAFSFVGPCCKPFGLRAPGVQSVGKEDSGKTVLGIIAGATYGGVPDSSLGFGSAWNGTPNGLEEYGPAHNDTLMVLDETSLMPTDQKGRPLSFGEALMRLMQGQGKKRHGQSVDRWSVPYVQYLELLRVRPARSCSEEELRGLHGSPHRHPDAQGQGVILRGPARVRGCSDFRQVSVRHRDHELRLSHSRVRRSLDFGARSRSRGAGRDGRSATSPRTKRQPARSRRRSAASSACAGISRPSMPSDVWRSSSRSCRSPRTSCSPPSCLAIAITLPSSIMKLLVAHPGQLEPLPFKRSSTRVQCESRLLALSFPPRRPLIVCNAISTATCEAASSTSVRPASAACASKP